MPEQAYHRVGGEEDYGQVLERKTLARRALLRDCLIAFGGAIIGAVLALVLFRLHPPVSLDDQCGRYLSAYESPLLNDVGIKFEKTRFDVASHNESIFQKAGSAISGVDEAWDSLGFDGDLLSIHVCDTGSLTCRIDARVSLPAAVGEAAGLKGHVRIPGSDDYIGFVEVLHQLHCLNMVRQGLYYNIGYYRKQGKGPFASSDEFLQYHLAHCVESIRQQLICSADFNFFGYVQVEHATGFDRLFPDYATEHVCRNFEDIKEWAAAHQDERLSNMSAIVGKLEVRPGDIILLEIP